MNKSLASSLLAPWGYLCALSNKKPLSKAWLRTEPYTIPIRRN